MNCVSATSSMGALASMRFSPASCPAEVTFVMEMNTACAMVSPPRAAIMPNVNETDR